MLSVVVLAFFETGSAAMDRTDLTVGMKTLPLLNEKLTGTVKIAILFDPGQADSSHEAEAIKSLIDTGIDMPTDLTIDAITVPINQMEKMAGSRIAIVTPNLKRYYDAISSSADMNKTLTITTDLDCVRQDKCILGVVSKPRVEIYYSKVAAENAKITFEQAFTMLAKPASY